HLRECRGDMHRCLLVLRQVIAELRILLKCLADAGDTPVTEDAQATGEKRLTLPIALDMLAHQELHDGLRDGEAFGFHFLQECFQNPSSSSTNFSASCSYAMKLAQPWRVTTIAPPALPMRAAL